MTAGPASQPASGPGVAPSIIITIDTEGDNLWSTPREIKVENARFLPRFQSLCEAHGLKPVYLTNYEMAACGFFQEFARDALRRGTAEVGMHLHAWNSPPAHQLTPDDYASTPYLIDYPPPVMRDKIAFLTDMLEDAFGVKMVSHRAGRWAFNGTYAQLLLERGYESDCSITPGVLGGASKAGPRGSVGYDYRKAPLGAYFLDPQDVSRPGGSGLLEIPMTIRPPRPRVAGTVRGWFRAGSPARQALDLMLPCATWFRPGRRNLSRMLGVLTWAIRQKLGFVEFMLHSSELMPGGSPVFATEDAIERLYEDMETIFASAVSAGFVPVTLTEYRKTFPAGGSSE
jgi:hypothetical protein